MCVRVCVRVSEGREGVKRSARLMSVWQLPFRTSKAAKRRHFFMFLSIFTHPTSLRLSHKWDSPHHWKHRRRMFSSHRHTLCVCSRVCICNVQLVHFIYSAYIIDRLNWDVKLKLPGVYSYSFFVLLSTEPTLESSVSTSVMLHRENNKNNNNLMCYSSMNIHQAPLWQRLLGEDAAASHQKLR